MSKRIMESKFILDGITAKPVPCTINWDKVAAYMRKANEKKFKEYALASARSWAQARDKVLD